MLIMIESWLAYFTEDPIAFGDIFFDEAVNGAFNDSESASNITLSFILIEESGENKIRSTGGKMVSFSLCIVSV